MITSSNARNQKWIVWAQLGPKPPQLKNKWCSVIFNSKTKKTLRKLTLFQILIQLQLLNKPWEVLHLDNQTPSRAFLWILWSCQNSKRVMAPQNWLKLSQQALRQVTILNLRQDSIKLLKWAVRVNSVQPHKEIRLLKMLQTLWKRDWLKNTHQLSIIWFSTRCRPRLRLNSGSKSWLPCSPRKLKCWKEQLQSLQTLRAQSICSRGDKLPLWSNHSKMVKSHIGPTERTRQLLRVVTTRHQVTQWTSSTSTRVQQRLALSQLQKVRKAPLCQQPTVNQSPHSSSQTRRKSWNSSNSRRWPNKNKSNKNNR